MNCESITTSLFTIIAVVSFCGSAHAQTQPGGAEEGAVTLTLKQLENLVAPVALYPDVLLDLVLDASRYPKAIVQAGDWLSNHKGKPDPKWPKSVQSLVQFPSVITMLDDRLSWATRLGAAYQNQGPELRKAIQEVRRNAKAAGTLVSNDKQTVETEQGQIEIVPTETNIIYVPTYDPSLIYASPSAIAAPLISFGAGVALGATLEHNYDWNHYWDNYAWYHHHYYDHIAHIGWTGDWGHAGAYHVGGPWYHAGHAGVTTPWGHAGVTHVGGPFVGATHVGAWGPFGHGGATVGHVGLHYGGMGHAVHLGPDGFHGGGFGFRGGMGGFHGGGVHFHGGFRR